MDRESRGAAAADKGSAKAYSIAGWAQFGKEEEWSGEVAPMRRLHIKCMPRRPWAVQNGAYLGHRLLVSGIVNIMASIVYKLGVKPDS